MTRRLLDPDRSRIRILASSTLHPIHTDAAVRGWIDAAEPTDPAAGEIEFDLAGMRSGNPLVDREADRRLQVKRYPVVTGRLTALTARPGEPGVFDGTGSLTFHGVTRTIHGVLRVDERDGVIGLTGTTTIDVTQFDVQPPSLLLVKVDKLVTIELEAFTAPS